MLATDFPLLKRWWPHWWLAWLGRHAKAGTLAKVTLWLAQLRESFTYRYERVKLGRIAASEERDLTFSRQVQHE
jgi:hypothetical protein